MLDRMDKEDYAAQLAREMRSQGIKFTCDDATKFIAALTATMTEGLARDRKLTISNFGTFLVAKYGAKIIRSPRGDKKKFFMPPTDVIKWKPSLKIRSRAGSTAITDDEYEKLKGHPQPEPEEIIPVPQPEELGAKRRNPFEVQINIVSAGNTTYFTDERSPLSRLTKALLQEMITLGAEKMEIRPEKEISRLIYLAQNQPLASRNIPKISHQVIIEKIKSLSIPEPDLLPDEKIISLSESEKIKIYSMLTPLGELMVLERV
ncbi:hypothetical protein COV40_00290 [Candidatus Berkelbacteria bacterium CG11_big_fil_rev_8_21_14_0_20_42_15]|uniref:Uncharacterized protein n=1 Tax=Candidatus Berkelbacteria bacterium CG11_big_fil_rev_8_21_14_0_20_42_15 TaxID=1974517 RepID=A0A2H0PZW9_9BACT|nr:MAG: hypothetical protein COV40_00290 [Candidatus Berkelbacteria bacterium CG11_big_fil_rev_8_21_14_0_20_42_15]